MKILINGNMGYIGPVVAAHLRRRFPLANLVGYDTGYFAGCQLDSLASPERALTTQHFGDVRQFSTALLEGVDAVIQLAAISNDPMGNAFEQVTAEVNALAVVAAAKAAKAAGVKNFVFASSCSVYGAAGVDAKKEESPLNPLSAYARSKIAAEEGIQSLAGPDFRVTCLRFATACGYSPRLRLDLVLNDFVAGALTTGKISILSDGTPWRPLIHVNDMARAIEWAVNRPATNGGAFLVVNAGSSEWNYQVHELARAVQLHFGTVEVTVNANAAPDKRSYRVDFGLFNRLAPGHQPMEDLRGAIAGLANGLQNVGFTDPNYRTSKLIRLKILTDLRIKGLVNDELYWKS